MILPSLNEQAERARALLSELELSLNELPLDRRQETAAELDHISRILEGLLPRTVEMTAGERVSSSISGPDSLWSRPATWLEDSLSEARVGAWRWNLRSSAVEWSEEMYKLHEYNPGLESMDFDCHVEFIHPDDRNRVIERLIACSQTAQLFVEEYRINSAKGRTIWVSSVAEVEQDPSGEPVRMAGITQDVTDRKLAEEDLRRAKQREQARAAELEAILDAVPALVWISRDPECREMTGSQYGYEFLRLGKDANLSKSAPEGDLAIQHFRNFKDGREIPSNELPMQIAAEKGIKSEDYEFDIVFDDGSARSLLGNVIPLFDRNGSPRGAVGAFVDITERKRIEAELLQGEARERARAVQLQAVIDAIPTPIFLTLDPNGLEITGNKAAYRMMRASPNSNLSRKTTRSTTSIMRDAVSGRELTVADLPMNRALRTGKPVDDFEAQLVFDDGTETSLWGGATPLFDESGAVSGAVATLVDVTARQAAEKSLRRSAERDAYRIELADAMRRLTDPEQIKSTAMRILGERLGASRVLYAMVEPGGTEVIINGGYSGDLPALNGRFRLSDFARNLMQDHPDGRPYSITDIPADPKLTEEQRAAYAVVGVRAHIDVPLVIDGRFVALLAVHQSKPRAWTEDEAALVVETAERTWASVERARAEAALRESEARFHASIESLMEGFVLYSPVRRTRTDGKPGKVMDFRYEYVNAAACRMNHRTREQMLGHTLLEVLPPALARALFKRYMRVIRTGEPLSERTPLGETPETMRIYDINAVKLGDGLVVTNKDVTEQVRLEGEQQRALTQVEIHHRLAEQSEKDRQSYARELHDGPIQTLASIVYSIQYIKETFPDPLLSVELEQINSAVRSAVQELRQVINELRPPSVLRFGLSKAIRLQSEDIREGGSRIEWSYRLAEDGNRLPVQICLALFRIYQEAVNNTVRHSGASRGWVNFQFKPGKLVLEIRDNGRGLPAKYDFDTLTLNNHFGLAGMSERAEAIGGRLEIHSRPGGGTRIHVVVPFHDKSQAENRESAAAA